MSVRLTTLIERHARPHRPDGFGRDRLDRRLGRCRHPARAGARSTASRICWSTWPSRARSGARRSTIAAEIEAVGGHLNAYTSREHTAYYAKVLEGGYRPRRRHPRRHPAAFGLRCRRARARARGDPAGDRPGATTRPTTSSSICSRRRAYPDQPMGRPVLGRAEIIRAIDRDTVADYLKRQLRRARHAAGGGGQSATTASSSASAEERIRRVCRARARRRASPRAMSAAITARTRDLEQVHVVLGFPGFAFADPDYYAASVVSTALGRRHVVAPLPGDPREARPRLFDLCLHPRLQRRRHVRRLCRHRRGRGGGADAGAVRGDRASSSTASRPGELDRARAQLKAGLADVARRRPRRAASSRPATCWSSAGRSISAELIRAHRRRSTMRRSRAWRARLRRRPPTFAALGPDRHGRGLRTPRRTLAAREGRAAMPFEHSRLAAAASATGAAALPRWSGQRDVAALARARAIAQEWAELRGESRNFLAPWEPSWPSDALTRAALSPPARALRADWRSDQGYSFLLFRREDDALLGGIGLSNVRRGVAETASLGYWIGERFARQGYMTEGLQPHARLRLRAPAAPPRRGGVPAAQRAEPPVAAQERLPRGGLCPRNICASTARWQDHVLFGLLREDWVKSGAGDAARTRR